MGLKLSTLYFEPQTGRPNLRFLTLKTALILGLYLNAYFFTVGIVRDNSMSPFLWKAGATHFSDLVLYGKVLSPTDRLKDRIVALKNPFEPKEVVFRRVIAEEGDWVQRADDGGIIKVPKGHVWVECENGKERRVDSLSEDLGGPVSKKFVQGQCLSIVWPLWRRTSFSDMDKFKGLLTASKTQHSRVYSNDEIFAKYGLR